MPKNEDETNSPKRKYIVVHAVTLGEDLYHTGSVVAFTKQDEREFAGYISSGYIKLAAQDAKLFKAPDPKKG